MAYSGSAIKEASPLEQLVMWLRDDVTVLEHIRDEEKEHFAELVKLIARIDEIQREKFLEEGNEHGDGGEEDNEVGESIAGMSSAAITVGSLKGKK